MFNKMILIVVLFGVSFSSIFCQLKKLTSSNLKTETEIYIDSRGNWWSNIVRIHFAQKSIDQEAKSKFASTSDILQPQIRKIFKDIEKKYGKFILQKTFTNSFWGDTIGVHVTTKEKVKLKDCSQFYKIIFDRLICVDSLILELKGFKYFESIGRPVGAIYTYTPNDYSASEQWALPKLEAIKAWDITHGSNQVRIGINDLFTHSVINDIHNELKNGKVVYNPDNLCWGHGQTVAGCASALTDNGTGISSIGFNTSLMFTDWGDDGINILRANGAHIINCSWIWWSYPELSTAIYNALNSGIIITAGAGNDQRNVSFLGTIPVITYPAAYNFSDIGGQVIAVTATHLDSGAEVFGYPLDGRWNYSLGTDPLGNPTTGFVDFSAPGVFIKCIDDTINNAYMLASGTSMEAPEVAGVIALIRSIYPNLTPVIAYTILKNSTDKVGIDQYYQQSDGHTWNQYMGYGRINAYKALKYTLENYGGTLTQTLTIPSGETWNFQPGVTVKFASGVSLIVNGTLNAVGNSNNRITFTPSGASGMWGGIKFNSGSSGSVQFCNISYANYGIHLYTSPSNIVVSDNIITNGNVGIYCQQTSSTLLRNTITGNSSYGLSSFDSDVYLTYNGQGNNVIRNNNYGLQSGYESVTYLSNGNNCVHDNTNQEIYALMYSVVNAENTWWNYTEYPYWTQSNFWIQYYSSVDADPNNLRSDPNNCPLNKTSNEAGKEIVTVGGAIDKEIIEILGLEKEGRYEEAIRNYKEKLKDKITIGEKGFVLSRLAKCYIKTERKDFTDYLNKEIRNNIKLEDELYGYSLNAENQIMLAEKNYEKAVNNYTIIREKYSTNEQLFK